MAKAATCECGFSAGGGEATAKELEEIMMLHVSYEHKDMLKQVREAEARKVAKGLVKEKK